MLIIAFLAGLVKLIPTHLSLRTPMRPEAISNHRLRPAVRILAARNSQLVARWRMKSSNSFHLVRGRSIRGAVLSFFFHQILAHAFEDDVDFGVRRIGIDVYLNVQLKIGIHFDRRHAAGR